MEENPEEQQPEVTNQEAQTPAPEPPHHETRRERRQKKRLMFIVGGAVLVVLLAAGAAYWFFLRGDKADQPTQTVTTNQNQAEANTPPPADPTPVTYKSAKLNIELTHRKDWTLKELSSSEITVTSPKMSYVALGDQSTTGVFTVKIRKGVTDTMKANIEKSVATRDSEVIAYAAPTDQQRQYTNLSYAGPKDQFGFFIVTGNTALKAGNSFAYSLPLDGEFYLIAGGYGTDKYDSLTFDSVPKASMDSTPLTQAVDIVKSLKVY